MDKEATCDSTGSYLKQRDSVSCSESYAIPNEAVPEDGDWEGQSPEKIRQNTGWRSQYLSHTTIEYERSERVIGLASF
jgi:hypothetical protein